MRQKRAIEAQSWLLFAINHVKFMSKNLTLLVTQIIQIGLFLSYDCSLLPHFTALFHKITLILNFKG